MSATNKPSRLPSNASAMSKSDSLPMLKIRAPDEVFIPSGLERSNSRKSDRSMDDSKSFDSFATRSTSAHKQVKGAAHSLSHPVQFIGRREIQLELSKPKEQPFSKLDILEAYLPKALRSEQSAAKKRLKLQNESDQQTLFNILKGERAAISSSLSVASYQPVHYASGDYSASNSVASTGDQHVEFSQQLLSLRTNDQQIMQQGMQQGSGKPSLWETTTSNGMQAREEIKRQVEEAEALARSAEIQDAIIVQKEQIKEKTMLKVKVLNEIMVNKIKLEEAISVSASQLSHLPHIRHKKAAGVSDYAIQNEALHVDFRNLALKPDEDIDYEAFERAQLPAFKQRVIAVKKNGEEGEDISYYSRDLKSVGSFSAYSGDDSLSSDVLRTLQDLGVSEIKAKLKTLATYINSHTSRKILDTWHLIEGRFKSSTHSKQVIELDANGLAHPVKHPAIPISALSYMLCSTKIKVGHEELWKMCQRLGFISAEQAFQARRIAAMQVILAMNDEVKSEHYETFKQELWQLSKGGEPLVSLQEFTDIIFSEDPTERENQFAAIKASRQEQVQAMMDEKKNKAATKQREAARKKQMVDDFVVALAQLQLMKGNLTSAKVTDFNQMIEKCKSYIDKQKEDQAANVPQDLVLFLGLEAYPQIIQDKIIAKREARLKQHKANHRPSDATATTINSEDNPFSKANIVAKKGLARHDVDDASIESHLSSVRAASTAHIDESASHTGSDPAHRASLTSQVTPAVKIHVRTYKRVILAGPPSVLEIMREMVSYGRGLHGLSYREAISILQAICTTKITAMFRCYRKRWRYSAARRMWNKHFLEYTRKHFVALRTLVRYKVNIRKKCWRKLKAWRYYTKRAHERRNTFRIAFWPFYVWHRYADAMGKAKDKATFLVGRVMPTITTIKVFRAWKGYAKLEGKLNRAADAFFQKLQRADTKVLLRWMHEWSHKRHAIRRAWKIKGNEMRLKYISQLVVSPFYTWRTYTNYRVITRGRARIQQHQMRHVVLKGKLPRHSLSNSQRRVAMKVAELKRRVKHRRVSQVELKDKLKKRAKAKKDSAYRKSGAVGGGLNESSMGSDEDSVGGRRKSSARTTSTAPLAEVPLDFHDATAALYKPDFKWENVDLVEFYDIDDDQEDEDGLSPLLLNSYRAARMQIMNQPDTLDHFACLNDLMVEHTALVREYYTHADHWNCFEAAFRFHFFGYRAFKNIQHFATQRRKVKLFMKVRLQRIKMQIINELRKSIEVRAKRNATVKGSEAERISQAVRAHQVAKVVRTRKFTAEVNNALGRDHDDYVDDEAARLNRIRALNLIDPDDEQYMEKEARRLEERQAEMRRLQAERDKKYQPPNLLEIDRKDRDTEHKQAEEMVAFSKSVHAKTADLVKTSDEITEVFREKMNRTEDMVLEVLATEGAVTTRAAEKQAAYMQEFKVHAANSLVDVLLKVYLQVQMSLMKEESKVYFRCLRLPMLLTRSKSMYFRKKLMNWIRICRRLNSISRNALYYQTTRTKWVIFNRWLKFIAIEKLNPTPGVVPMLKRKAQLIPDFDQTLQRNGFEKSVYVDNERLQHSTSEFKSVFSRWKMLTQEEILFRLLSDRAKQMFRLSLLQKCFWAMKTGMDLVDYMKLIREDPPIFPLVRARADIDQAVKNFIVVRRKSIATVMRRNNRKYVKFVIKDGQTSLSFKSFMTDFKASTNARISTEQRMISDYFEVRGTQQFFDVHAPGRDHPIVPQIMAKVTGREIADPHTFTADGRSITVPGGYKLSRVKFAFQYGVGIIGWQLFWTADGAKELESPPRGSWTSASLGANELVIPKDDFVVGLEYLYDSDVIVGVRLKLLVGGFTKWIGGKTSLSTLGVYMDCDNATPREEYEDVRDSALDPDELRDPALPYKFVIGFTGVITAGRTTCLGLVIRKVTKQNLFSYNWVGDALWKAELEKSEAAAEATLPSIDLYSMPTHLSQYVTGPPVGPPVLDAGDSITMSNVPSLMSVEEYHKEADASSVGSLAESDSLAESSTVFDEDESVESKSQSQSGAEASKPKPRARRMGISNPVVSKLMNTQTIAAAKEALSSSEVQFFDVLRMRTTELSHARSRAMEFARNLWTNKNLRLDSTLCKLVVIRVVRGLSMWLFNALSKRMMPESRTEKSALKLLRNAKVLLSKADAVRNRANIILANADVLESSAQLWTGKHLLSPKERALKAAHHQKIAAMRKEAAKVKRDENFLRLQAVIDEKRGLAQMPKLTLSHYVVNNYRLKLAAARHKESLLERMSLEDVKTGLFGSNLKEKLLSKEQMQAIHESLRSQQLKLKDTTSLERLVDGVVDEEAGIAEQEGRRTIDLPRTSVRRGAGTMVAPVVPRATLKPIAENSPPKHRKLSHSVALRLNSSSLVNHRVRTPLVMTDRIGSPENGSTRVGASEDKTGRATGGRSYSILEFNPLILPEVPAPSSANTSPARRRTSPNRRVSSSGGGVGSSNGASAQARAGTVVGEKKLRVSPPKVRQLSMINSYGEDDASF